MNDTIRHDKDGGFTVIPEKVMIKTHKITGQRLLIKTSGDIVSVLYVLDENNNKILDKNSSGIVLLDIKGEQRYQIAICDNTNLTDKKTLWK